MLKSLGIEVDFSFDAPDFVVPMAKLAIEAVIASSAQGAKPEWEKTMADLTYMATGQRYLETLARLSNSIDTEVRRYRQRYAALPHMDGLSYVIATHNFGTPDAHQLGDAVPSL